MGRGLKRFYKRAKLLIGFVNAAKLIASDDVRGAETFAHLIPILGLLLVAFLGAIPAHAALGHVSRINAGACQAATNKGNSTGTCTASSHINTFTHTPSASNNGILISVACSATGATPSAVAVTASGWTITQVGGIVGSTTLGFQALFKAYALNTSATTFTDTWTVTTNSCSGFMNDIIIEWSGEDLTNFVDASGSGSGTGGCGGTGTPTVTPTVNNDGVFFGLQ